ncbi:tetratricopeptide repeat protein [Hyphomicrobium facile]|uniref:protein O-GlcNAc transferase n=1 Tax=Hyphomicrobium facile TaxID=51670 RepID=A0A1I7NWV5_9HYPH|nr:tetratricopeptide repeat protein [Hyphomicrobium facile]SFV39145.1 Predicted O-linked N-acetylglucosamine transferase, SPINDLY family [Hyphomicrobium facile]
MNRRDRRLAHATSRSAPQRLDDPEVARDYHQAVQHLKNDRLAEAEVAHRRVLARLPTHAPSLHHLGLIAYKRQETHDAVEYIRQSVAQQPDYHEAWLNLAIILGEMRRSHEAIAACRECLALQPQNAEVHTVLGNLLTVVENDSEAMATYIKALDLKPDQPAVLVRLGNLMLKSGQVEAAVAHCQTALKLDPEFEEARVLGHRISAMTRPVTSIAAEIEAESKSNDELAKRLDELASFLRQGRRYDEAIELCRRATDIKPGKADYHFNLALALEGRGLAEEALESYQAGLAIEPDRAEAYTSVGGLLQSLKMEVGAIQALEHAIKLDPTSPHAHYNLAIVCKMRQQYDQAKAAFQKCRELAPDAFVNRFEFLNLLHFQCDWDGVDEEARYCLENFRVKPMHLAPFQLISLGSTRADQLRAAQNYIKPMAVPEQIRFKTYQNSLGVGRRIRLGFLSCDFFEHATAILFSEVLEKLDKNRFEIFGYCFSPEDGSAMRGRLLKAFEHVRKIGEMTNREAAATINADAIDILVDLKGYTRDGRPEILSYRPAPIQVNYLGYPATMGADFIDYIVADAIVTPMEHQADYSEKIVQLPHTYQPNDRQRKISDEPITRADCGLPENAFVFCSFNNSYKLTPTMFDVWMHLLKEVPGSVLWLLVPNETCASNLRREAASRGVDASRLVFADRMPVEKHLARQHLADLFLDALPCNAHTTASDALWAGLPVLTCLGETFAGRVAGSLLSAMGVPELITTDLDAYTCLALELARDKGKLDRIRQKLVSTRDTAPIFDSTRYTRNLEASFEKMVEIMRSGQAPQAFAVVEPTAVPPPVKTIEPQPQGPRAIYEACPLCESREISRANEARITNHSAYNSMLPQMLKWCRCGSCAHVFTEGYLTPEGHDIVYPAAKTEQKVGRDAENQRKVSAKIVARVARHVPSGDWLDVGFGNASLLFTAAEWGFSPAGIDASEESVAKLKKFGYEAHRDLEALAAEDRFSVVSMVDVLDRSPFPATTLGIVNRMMKRGGALFISSLNMDSIVWRALDATGTNPYWAEIERYHHFTRARLVQLLQSQGFKFAEYDIGDRHRSSMDLIALKI